MACVCSSYVLVQCCAVVGVLLVQALADWRKKGGREERRRKPKIIWGAYNGIKLEVFISQNISHTPPRASTHTHTRRNGDRRVRVLASGGGHSGCRDWRRTAELCRRKHRRAVPAKHKNDDADVLPIGPPPPPPSPRRRHPPRSEVTRGVRVVVVIGVVVICGVGIIRGRSHG